MNLLYIFLSIYFSIFAPTFTNSGGGSQDGNGTTTVPGGPKGGNNGDFIIAVDTKP